MNHLLDNPIWHALNAGNSHLATGNDHAKVLVPEVGVFAGLKDNSIENLMDLGERTPVESVVVLFTPAEISVPDVWEVVVKKPLLQMVYAGKDASGERTEATVLTDSDIDSMLALTALTEPGPFLRRTIDFGNYKGFFREGQLIAMAGQRLKPGEYVEISAVCTHPGHTGKGYAGKLIGNQIYDILENSGIPFLHVLPENRGAYRLYEKLGFDVRMEMICYALKKVES